MSRPKDDQDFFRHAMSDVRPINKQANRVALKKASDSLNHAARRQAATEQEIVDQSGLTGSEEHIEMLSPIDVLEY